MRTSGWTDFVERLVAGMGLADRLGAAAPPRHPMMRPVVTVMPMRDGTRVFLDVTVLAREGAEKSHPHPADGRLVQDLTSNFPFDPIDGETAGQAAARMEGLFTAAVGVMRAVWLNQPEVVANGAVSPGGMQ